MGTKMVLETYEVLDEGVYDAVVKNLSRDEGEWGSYWMFEFDLGEGVVKKGACSDKFSTLSKLYKWSRAILAQKLEPGFELDTDDLIGRPCQLVISHELDKEGNERDKISQVLPAPKKAAMVLEDAGDPFEDF